MGVVGEYTETSSTANTIASGADTNFHYITGNAFSQVVAADSLNFTASQCALTATKSGRYAIRIGAALYLADNATGYSYLGAGVDVDADTVGQDLASLNGKIGTSTMIDGGAGLSSYGAVWVERVVSLNAGQIVRPVFAAVNNTGANPTGHNLAIDHLVLIAQPLPAS